ncbi:hypothetical protein HID58_069541, partial [Brassica napus]
CPDSASCGLWLVWSFNIGVVFSIGTGKLCSSLVCNLRVLRILGNGLWSLCSIATSIAKRVCVSSLAARVDGLFFGGFCCLKK